VEVIRATLLDMSTVLSLLADMHQESELEAVNWNKVTHIVTDCVSQGLVLVAVTDDNEIAGSIGGAVSSEWYSDAPLLGDYWFYVRPEHRATPAAFKLVKAWKDIAKSGDLAIKMGHVLGEDIDRKDKMFEKLGFEKLGSMYGKEKANGRAMPTDS
jgi:hypothetical protein